jgi:hypothetical protein
MDTSILVLLVVRGKGRENPKFDARGITVLRNRADDLDGTSRPFSPVEGFYDFTKSPLAE